MASNIGPSTAKRKEPKTARMTEAEPKGSFIVVTGSDWPEKNYVAKSADEAMKHIKKYFGAK